MTDDLLALSPELGRLIACAREGGDSDTSALLTAVAQLDEDTARGVLAASVLVLAYTRA